MDKHGESPIENATLANFLIEHGDNICIILIFSLCKITG